MIQIEKSKKRRFLMKSRRIKCITLLCIAVISANISLPSISVLANEQDNTTLNYSSEAVIVTDTELIINGHSYTEQELVELLETATPQPRSAIAIGGAAYYAGSYFIRSRTSSISCYWSGCYSRSNHICYPLGSKHYQKLLQ